MHQFLPDFVSQSQQSTPATPTTTSTSTTTYPNPTQNQQSTPASASASAPAPASQAPPTDDVIEAIIQQATSARATPDGRPLRDTRTQLFVGNVCQVGLFRWIRALTSVV